MSGRTRARSSTPARTARSPCPKPLRATRAHRERTVCLEQFEALEQRSLGAARIPTPKPYESIGLEELDPVEDRAAPAQPWARPSCRSAVRNEPSASATLARRSCVRSASRCQPAVLRTPTAARPRSERRRSTVPGGEPGSKQHGSRQSGVHRPSQRCERSHGASSHRSAAAESPIIKSIRATSRSAVDAKLALPARRGRSRSPRRRGVPRAKLAPASGPDNGIHVR